MDYSKSKVVAIIPARGGSKSIPRKNIKLFNGFPLIAYSIIAALCTESIHRVIVSTDDVEIADIARQWGAETPFMRPDELAGDRISDLPVFQHALRWLADVEGYKPEWVVQLRCTSPIRPINCIEEAIHDALVHQPDCVRSVTESGQNPYKMWQISDGRMRPLIETSYAEAYNMPRQSLPATFWQTGHLEVIHRDTILQKHSMTGTDIRAFQIDSEYAIDLDTPVQWDYGEYLLRRRQLTVYQPNNPLIPETFSSNRSELHLSK